MKKLFLTTAFLVGSLQVQGATDPFAQQLFVIAEQRANLFHDSAAPFQLEVDFSAQLNVPTEGHLTLKWEGKDRWWSKVVLGEFEQITIRNGDRRYITRNAGFTPLRVGELTSLIHFAAESEGQTAKKLQRRVENGAELGCIAVEREKVKGESHEVCVDVNSHEILSEEWREAPDERRREQFSDYFDFGASRYPRKLQFQEDGIKVVAANVISLQAATFDEKLLVAPEGAIERRQCTDMKRAVPVKTPDPLYPKSASRDKLMGDTSVAMTVLVDGSVSDIQLIGRATQSMDDATLRTLKGWKFKPAMCGADPIVSDIVVVVSFRLE
jgi:TonB family protein